jgi:hypothetical protein
MAVMNLEMVFRVAIAVQAAAANAWFAQMRESGPRLHRISAW